MVLLLQLLLLGLCSQGRGDFSPPRFNVSLEMPPAQRWEPVLKHYDAARFRRMVHQVIYSIAPKWVISIIEQLAPQLGLILPQPYEAEIQGISKALGLRLGDGLLINLVYEISGFCTSIVAQDSRGNIYHGRNLDYQFSDILRSLTVDLQFVKNGQIIYTGTTFVGFVGLWTGQSPNKFTISGNARGESERSQGTVWKKSRALSLMSSKNKEIYSTGTGPSALQACTDPDPLSKHDAYFLRDAKPCVYNQNFIKVRGEWWKTMIAALLKRNPPPSWLIRDTLLEAADFQAALRKLANSPITANVYYILGGVKPTEGVIITRNLSGPVDIWPLMPMKGQWYRVETNYDHWKAPPPFDDRRTPAVRALNATGQDNINLHALFKVLSIKPVLNNFTVYTTLMCAAQPYDYRTLIWT
ncbi:N-acylethanolamine-hydrolyzing acid amidase-like isoform X1 [Heterodontus francisci]|uniref:N-acylethanolamine-hydrolyzing acid amidase-like isoform X1 n=1 Tax=Heterodontus francisci TaxID=7792 RepID=UPI00355B623D